MVPFLNCWLLSLLPVAWEDTIPNVIYYNFAISSKLLVKSGDSNKCYVSDWVSLFSFEKRMPYAEKGMKVNGK